MPNNNPKFKHSPGNIKSSASGSGKSSLSHGSQSSSSQHHTNQKKAGAWETESSVDENATLEELIDLPPFRQASDDSGNSFTCGTRIPNWMHRRMQKIVEMPGSPYQIMSDLSRDCIYKGLRILQMKYRATKDWAAKTKLSTIVDDVSASKEIRQRFNEFVEGLSSYLEENERKEAISKLEDYMSALIEVEDEWYKNRVFTYMHTSKIIQELIQDCTPGIKRAFDNWIPLTETEQEFNDSKKKEKIKRDKEK